MKKILTLTAAFAFIATISFGQQRPAPKTAAKNPSEDTIQYSLGVYMMEQLFAKTGFVVNDKALFMKAIDDILSKRKPMVDPNTVQDRLLAYQHVYQAQRGKQLEALLFDKVKKEKDFTEAGGGVYYSVAKKGTGLMPGQKDTVVMNVICTLPDGTVVDDTNKSKQSYMAIAGEMIPGLRQVLYKMPEGSIFRAIIPASMPYGEPGTNTIPPNSAIIYDVALVSVRGGK